jgi:hypothetical protein
MRRRFPRNYWKNLENVISHLQPYIENYGRLPKTKELSDDGLSMLSKSISKYHGGIESLSKKINVPTADGLIGKKPRDYWTHEKSLETIHEYLQQSDDPTKQPTRKELTQFNPNFISALAKKTLKQLLEDYRNTYDIQLVKHKSERKWTKELIEKKIRELTDQFGYIPTQSDLSELKLDGLRGVISKTGGVNYYSEKLDLPTKSQFLGLKPAGYWMDLENVKKEILPLIKKLGHFPSDKELTALDKKYLNRAYQSHGGLKKLAIKLDIELESVGFYVTMDGHYVRSRYEVLFDNFLSINSIPHESEGLISENHNYLFDFKLTDIRGNNVYVEIWGYSVRHNTDISNTYNLKRIEKEKVYTDLGLLLISLEEDDFDKPFETIYRKLTGVMISYEIQTEFKPIKNIIDYFIGKAYGFDELLNELQPHIDNLDGKMPTSTYLKALKLEGLNSKVSKYGGYPFVAEKLGLESWDKSNNPEIAEKLGLEIIWTDGRFEKELEEIVFQFGYIPTQSDLLEIGKGDLLGKINRDGGSQKVAEKYGYQTKTQFLGRSHNFGFDDWETFKLALEIIVDEIGMFPSTKWLRENGHTTLENFIYKYGGIDEVAKKIGHKSQSEQINKWLDKNYCLLEFKKLANRIGKTPTKKDLEENGLSGLYGAIKKHYGGIRNTAIEVGMSPTRPPMGHWKDFDNVKKSILEVEKKLGHYPSQEELKKEGYGGMVATIYRHHGGLTKVKSIIQSKKVKD